MAKLGIQGIVMCTIMFGAFAPISASGEVTLLALWLIDEMAVVTLTSIEISWKIVLINKAGIGGTPRVTCEGAFDGSIGSNGEGEITEVLTGGVAAGTPLVGTSLLCVTTNATLGCGATGSEVEVWPENLPWLILVFLMKDGPFLVDRFKEGASGEKLEPAYDVHCVATGTDDLCEGLFSWLTENGTEGEVLVSYIENSDTEACEIGTLTLLTETPGLMKTLNGSMLSVSSE